MTAAPAAAQTDRSNTGGMNSPDKSGIKKTASMKEGKTFWTWRPRKV
jgi:hypothetical protein